MRPRGGLIASTLPTWTTTATSGVFTLREAQEMRTSAQWPRGPVAPTGLTATAGNLRLDLAWTAPATTHGTITNYLVEYTPSGGSASYVLTNSTGTSYALTGLTNGTSYTVRVAAVNFTAGDYSGAATGTPAAIAGTLSVLRNTNPSNGQFYVAGAGTLASPYFYQRGGFVGSEPPVFQVVGTLNLTIVFPNTVKIYKGTEAVTESIVSFATDPRIGSDSFLTVAQAGGTTIASGRNTTVTVLVTDKYLKVGSSAFYPWFPAADNPIAENIYPSVRLYAS